MQGSEEFSKFEVILRGNNLVKKIYEYIKRIIVMLMMYKENIYYEYYL